MRIWYIFGGIAVAALMLFLGAWLWVLASPEPMANPVARSFPWPVACTTRGCITTTRWQEQAALEQTFAKAAQAEVPPAAAALTSLVRQHLVAHSVVRAPVTMTDATRYRTDILNLKDEPAIRDMTGLSAADYDRLVVLPYLFQEAVRQQRKIESQDELYMQLSRERTVVILPFRVKWDKNAGKVVE